jgi:hypothetical protein
MHFVKNHAKNILDEDGSDFTDHNLINGFVVFFSKQNTAYFMFMTGRYHHLPKE